MSSSTGDEPTYVVANLGGYVSKNRTDPKPVSNLAAYNSASFFIGAVCVFYEMMLVFFGQGFSPSIFVVCATCILVLQGVRRLYDRFMPEDE